MINEWDKLMEPVRKALEALINHGDAMADRIEELEAINREQAAEIDRLMRREE